MEINGVAHIILRVNRFDECAAFYDQLMPRLGLEAVFHTDDFIYYVGGRTAVGIRRSQSLPAIATKSWLRASTTCASGLAPATTSMSCTRL
jgi:catechol 2,3-dioxygenase-like lactoylglutathione lyase family enzyme